MIKTTNAKTCVAAINYFSFKVKLHRAQGKVVRLMGFFGGRWAVDGGGLTVFAFFGGGKRLKNQ